MTDPYRYLPCSLHPALAVPAWAKIDVVVLDETGPFRLLSPSDNGRNLHIDLAHPAGWDHAVRAYAIIRGVTIPESASVSLGRDPEGLGGPVALTTNGEAAECEDETLVFVVGIEWDDMETPAQRREALCRCICAALGVEVGEVFS